MGAIFLTRRERIFGSRLLLLVTFEPRTKDMISLDWSYQPGVSPLPTARAVAFAGGEQEGIFSPGWWLKPG